MSVNFIPPPFTIVIDTDAYAGNFEREMCAFITGQIGECSVGEPEADAARKTLVPKALKWFEGHVCSMADEHGTKRPCSIWPTPKWFNHGHGGHFRDGADPVEVQADYEKAVRKTYDGYKANWQTQLDIAEGRIPNYFVLGKPNPVAVCEQEIKRINKQMDDHIKRGPGRYPAYNSVAIFVDEPPPPAVWAVIKKRAQEFATKSDDNIYTGKVTITGYRQLKFELVQTELSVP